MNCTTAPVRRSTCAAMPLLVERADADAHQRERHRHEARGVAAEAHLVADDEPHAGQAEDEAAPLARQHALAEPGAGEQHGEQRLQPDDHRARARRHAGLDRHEHAAEVERVHERRRRRRGGRLRAAWATSRASRARRRPSARATSSEAHEQERERRRVRQPVLRGDEAGAPQHARRAPGTRPRAPAARPARGALNARSASVSHARRGSRACARARPGRVARRARRPVRRIEREARGVRLDDQPRPSPCQRTALTRLAFRHEHLAQPHDARRRARAARARCAAPTAETATRPLVASVDEDGRTRVGGRATARMPSSRRRTARQRGRWRGRRRRMATSRVAARGPGPVQ